MFSDLATYAWALLDKYQQIAGIVVPSFVVGYCLNVLKWLREKKGYKFDSFILPARILLLMVSMFAVGFLAWRDEHNDLIDARSSIINNDQKFVFGLLLNGEIQNYGSGSPKDVKLSLILKNTSGAPIIVTRSVASYGLNNDPISTTYLDGMMLRPGETKSYIWTVGKADDVPATGSGTIDPIISYSSPGSKHNRQLSSHLLIDYVNNNGMISCLTKSYDERDIQLGAK